MRVKYKDKKIESVCEDFGKAQKNYGKAVAERLHRTIEFIVAAECLSDVRNFPPFRLHGLKGDREGQFAIDLGKMTGMRLLIIPLNDKEAEWQTNDEALILKSTKVILALEVTKHYE